MRSYINFGAEALCFKETLRKHYILMNIRFVRSYVSFRVEAYALKEHYLLK